MPVVDTEWDNVKLLLRSVGSAITDMAGHSITLTGDTSSSLGTATIPAAASMFGSPTTRFHGADIPTGSSRPSTGATITSPDINVMPNYYYTSLTVEAFVYSCNDADHPSYREPVFSIGDIGSNHHYGLYLVGNTPVVEVNEGTGEFGFYSTRTIAKNEWHHYAVVKIGSIYVLYIDGLQEGWSSISKTPTPNHTIHIGKGYYGGQTLYFNGYMAEARVTDLVARYPFTYPSFPPFTPPSELFWTPTPGLFWTQLVGTTQT